MDFPYIYQWYKIIREKERERIFRITINSFLKIIINIPHPPNFTILVEEGHFGFSIYLSMVKIREREREIISCRRRTFWIFHILIDGVK